jgi:hypothetical protein
MVNGLVDRDAPLVEIFLQQIVHTQELHAFIGKPILQTKPGRIVGVPSLG